MDFTIEMKEAMKHLRNACKMNDTWKRCVECPFRPYCDTIEQYGYGLGCPCSWKIDE